MDVRITGANDLAALSKRLRQEGEQGKGLRREVYRGIQRSTKPAKAELRQATSRLPQGGGLAALIARAKISTRTRGGGKNVGVTITAKGTAVRSTDMGTVRHRVFDRGPWVTQRVPPGWFSETLQRAAPRVRREIVQAMHVVAQKIARH